MTKVPNDILTILTLTVLVVTVSTNEVHAVLNSAPVVSTEPEVAVPEVADSIAFFTLVQASLFSVNIFIFCKFSSVTEAFVPMRLPEYIWKVSAVVAVRVFTNFCFILIFSVIAVRRLVIEV